MSLVIERRKYNKLMKKSLLVLLPLMTLALVGCRGRGGRGGRSSASNPSGQTTQTQPSGTSGATTSGGGGPSTPTQTSQAPVEGAEHALPWNCKAEDYFDESRGSGYNAYEGNTDADGTIINFHNAYINDDPGSLKIDKKAHAFQLAKSNHEKYPKGVLTISKVKPSKVTVKVLLKSDYTWSSTQIGTVTFGSKTLTVPGTSTSVAVEGYTGWNLHTVTLDVNATQADNFVVTNTGTFAFYIAAFEFAA